MATEIVRLCDPHLIDHGTRTPGEAYTIDLGDGPRVVDMCEEHRDELLKPLADALYLYGVKPVGVPAAKQRNRSQPATATAVTRGEPGRQGGRRAITDGLHACPFCTFTVNAQSAIYRHMDRHHGFHNLQGAMDHQCPLCGDRFPQSGKANLSMHVKNVHDQPTVTRALRAARDAGDPYGVDARVQAGPL